MPTLLAVGFVGFVGFFTLHRRLERGWMKLVVLSISSWVKRWGLPI